MYSMKASAQARTRRRVRGTLWLACALAIAIPAWLAATFWLLENTVAVVAGLAPVAAYVVWRIASEMTDENDIGVSRLDRIWLYVEKYLPNAAVRRVAWRTVRSVVAMGAIAGVLFVGFLFVPKREAPAPLEPIVTRAPAEESEVVIEPRQITGLFAMKVDTFPQMSWPAYGTMAAFYDSDNPYGIEIYVGSEGKAFAAARGNVVYAGPDVCCGYGYTVVMEHEGGWTTTYGRLSDIAVKQGDRIKAGDWLGTGGAPDGQAPRVHFQVQRNGRSYNPLNVLPASQMGVPLLPAANQVCGSDALTLDANSVVNMALTSSALLRYELDASTVTSITEGAPNIEAGLSGLLSFRLQVPPSPDADYVLHLSLHKPDDRIAIECPLALRNATEVPLGGAPVVRLAPVITPTPYGGTPTPTPFPSLAPSVTPAPAPGALPANAGPAVRTLLPSPTPFGGTIRMISTRTPTPTPNPKAPSKTPKPSGTARPSPTATPVKAPQTFPKSYEGLANAISPPEP